MPLFFSDRERRLWAGTLAVVLAIYSTLGLAGTLAGAVSQDLLAAVMAVTAIAALRWARRLAVQQFRHRT